MLASESPCRAAGDRQPDPIRRLEALCTARRGTRMSLNRFQGASRGQPLKRRVDAAYLQPYGFRYQLSRFLRAEHQCLLRRLATWQLLRRASSTFPSKQAAHSRRAHCECFFAFCNLQFCSSMNSQYPIAQLQNTKFCFFAFCNYVIMQSMNSSA